MLSQCFHSCQNDWDSTESLKSSPGRHGRLSMSKSSSRPFHKRYLSSQKPHSYIGKLCLGVCCRDFTSLHPSHALSPFRAVHLGPSGAPIIHNSFYPLPKPLICHIAPRTAHLGPPGGAAHITLVGERGKEGEKKEKTRPLPSLPPSPSSPPLLVSSLLSSGPSWSSPCLSSVAGPARRGQIQSDHAMSCHTSFFTVGYSPFIKSCFMLLLDIMSV